MEPFDHDESRPTSNEPPEELDSEVDATDASDGEEDFDQEDDIDDDPEEDDLDEDDAEEDDDDEDDVADDDEDDPLAAAPRPQRQGPQARDERAEAASDFLYRILSEMGMDVSVRRRRPRPDSSPDEIHLEIVGHDVGRVIGKKGQVLSALQYLVNRVANRPGLPRRHVVLDAEGYRHRRETTLASLARRLGEQAVKEGKIITFEPMSPRDRRVVHLALAKFPNVVTKSDGEGDERRVRIIPVRR
jgi:spoIIIJ-associated protein